MTVSKQIRLGIEPHVRQIRNGILATHALTMAQPRTGKGATQIIPTLRETWTGNVLCVDPKGEALKESAAWREALGQQVIAIDPVPNRSTREYCAPEKYRMRFNPLDLVAVSDLGIHDIKMLADGLVVPDSGAKDPFFDKTARTLVAGIIAFILEFAPEEERHLGSVRELLMDMVDPDQREDLFKQMNDCYRYGGLARQAVTYMRREGGKSDSIYTTAADHLEWLSDPFMVDALKSSDFDLHDLRNKPTSLFLVLPFSALEFHRVFLRLFVRCCLSIMELGEVASGKTTNRPTLFILDEFHRLGKIGNIIAASSSMPGYGLHLWPICHGLGQLHDLYGREGAEVLLGASDYVCMFGIGNDQTTAEYASRRIGNLTSAEVAGELDQLAFQREESEKVRHASDSWLDPYYWQRRERSGAGFFYAGDPVVQDQRIQAEIGVVRSRIGRPRISPEDVISLTARKEGETIANAMIVCRSSGGYEILSPLPYFLNVGNAFSKPRSRPEQLTNVMVQCREIVRDLHEIKKGSKGFQRLQIWWLERRNMLMFHSCRRRLKLIYWKSRLPRWLDKVLVGLVPPLGRL